MVAGGRIVRDGEISGCQDIRPAALDGGGVAVVDIGCGVQAKAGVAVLVVIPGEEVLEWAPAASIEVNRPGNAGRY